MRFFIPIAILASVLCFEPTPRSSASGCQAPSCCSSPRLFHRIRERRAARLGCCCVPTAAAQAQDLVPKPTAPDIQEVDGK